ncbi:a1-alpha2 repression [Clydaea vesicula]|uniref:A1-alpha2 repression n=1 Tax=Clydaea vesicula TaxID=447962 RepID=A0AAD5U9W9_9FUNG|nr:a1-alpha2 repression [Clydaea vesicula]
MNEISVASQPSLKSVDNELLKKLFFYGGILLFANPPQITEFTIDFKTWQVGEKFKGLKFIPLGFHFISFQLIGSESTYLFWHFFNQNEVLVINWNTETEEFFKAQPEEIARYKYNIQEFDKFLGPYPLEESRSYEEFCALTSKLTAELLKNILPKSKDSDNKIVLNSFEVTSHLSKGNANVENNFLNFIHFDFKNFKKLKKHNLQSFRMQEHSDTDKIANISNSVNEKISSNLVGENLTNFYLDKSLLFENILMDFDKNRILGEYFILKWTSNAIFIL